jgi:biotin carboxyl carrier protein
VAITYTLTLDDRVTRAEVWQDGDTYVVRIDGREQRVSMASIDGGALFSFLIDGISYEVHARARNGAYDLLVRNEPMRVTVERGHRHVAARSTLAPAGVWAVESPMTGLVTEVVVAAGQAVEPGSVLLILEAMKMKNEVRATRPGIVERVDVKVGQSVKPGQALVHGRVGVVD